MRTKVFLSILITLVVFGWGTNQILADDEKEQYQFPKTYKDEKDRYFSVEGMNKVILDYPMKIFIGNRASLIVNIPTDWCNLFGEKVKKGELDDNANRVSSYIKHNFRKISYIFLSIGENAETQLQDTIKSTYVRSAYNRPNTWNGSNPPIKIPNAGFVWNFDTGGSLICCINNCKLMISTESKKENLSPDELENIALKFVSIISTNPNGKITEIIGSDLNIDFQRTDATSGVIKWTLGKPLMNCWVRVDVDSGQLQLQPDHTVLLQNIPPQGTCIHIYAISPDGSKWYKVSKEVTGTESKSGLPRSPTTQPRSASQPNR